MIYLPKIDYNYEIKAKYSTNCTLPKDSIDLKTCYNSDGNSADDFGDDFDEDFGENFDENFMAFN